MAAFHAGKETKMKKKALFGIIGIVILSGVAAVVVGTDWKALFSVYAPGQDGTPRYTAKISARAFGQDFYGEEASPDSVPDDEVIGNESGQPEALSGNTQPGICLQMPACAYSPKKTGGRYYHSRKNASLTITVEEAIPLEAVKVKISGKNGTIIKELPDFFGQMREAEGGMEYSCTVGAPELVSLGDGTIETAVTVLDQAGNMFCLADAEEDTDRLSLAGTKEDADSIDTAGSDGDADTSGPDSAQEARVTVENMEHRPGQETASFVLDTVCPHLASVMTKQDANKGYDEKGMLYFDNVNPYPGVGAGDFYYNDDCVETIFQIEDTNPGFLEMSCMKDEQTLVTQKGNPDGDGGTLVLKEEGRYTDLTVRGYDRAGNPLVLERTVFDTDGRTRVQHGTAYDLRIAEKGKTVDQHADEQTDNPSDAESLTGEIHLKYGKVIDRTPPQARIVHTSEARAYLYPAADGVRKAGKNSGTADVKDVYMGSDIRTEIRVSDDQDSRYPWALDPDKIRLFRNDVLQADIPETASMQEGSRKQMRQKKNERQLIQAAYVIRKDGRNTYQVCGTDRAGNLLRVKEILNAEAYTAKGSSSGTGADVSYPKGAQYQKGGICKSVSWSDYHSRFRLVRDTVCPEFTLEIDDVKDPEQNVDGKTAYYRRGFRGMFRIREANFDPKRVGAAVFRDRDTEYYSDSRETLQRVPSGSGFSGSSGGKGGKTCTLSVRDDAQKEHNGAWHFAIRGCDKAGNPLIRSTAEEKWCGTWREMRICDAESGCFMSHRKVLDTVAPKLILRIGTGKKDDDYYHLIKGPDGTFFDPVHYEPFRKETEAVLTLKSSDRSPVSLQYAIESSAEEPDDRTSEENSYENARSAVDRIEGEQIFQVRNVELKDRAGNVTRVSDTSRIYLDVSAPKQDISAPVVTIQADRAVTKRSADGRGLYDHPVTLRVKVRDPGTGASGLKRVVWTVKADGRVVEEQSGSVTLFEPKRDLPVSYSHAPEQAPINTEYENTIVLPAGGIYETNQIEVEVRAEDNSGNRSDPNHGGRMKLGIDTIGPQIHVAFSNNHVRNKRYFRKPRHAVITITERNMDEKKIHIRSRTEIPDTWRWSEGRTVAGNDDTWKKELDYTRDGDYTLDVSGTDALGNAATVRYEGTAPKRFVIDRTPPLIRISFDHNDVKNGKYYRTARCASIEITEHNFRPSDVRVQTDAEGPRGGKMPAPEIDGFQVSGSSRDASQKYLGSNLRTLQKQSGDRHTASIRFTEDGSYRFTVDAVDPAGNRAKRAVIDEFVIDGTAPVLNILNVTDEAAYAGKVAPEVVIEDDHFRTDGIRLRVTGIRTANRKELIPRFTPAGAFGGSYRFADMKETRKNDDVYTVSAVAADLAGNRAEKKVRFSVNRFGSSYDYNNDRATTQLAGAYYTKQEQMIRIREINLNRLKTHQVTLYRDGENKVLEEGSDYRMIAGAGQGAMQYIYEINASNFEKEGSYQLVVESKDEAGNKNSSGAIRGEDSIDALNLKFAVDKTPPEIRVEGLKAGSDNRFDESEKTIVLTPSDNQSLDSLRLIADEQTVLELDGEELRQALESKGGRLEYTFLAASRWQTFRAVCTDAAGNTGSTGEYRLLVTTDPAVHFFSYRPLLFAVIAAAAAAVFIISRRIWSSQSRHKEDGA